MLDKEMVVQRWMDQTFSIEYLERSLCLLSKDFRKYRLNIFLLNKVLFK